MSNETNNSLWSIATTAAKKFEQTARFQFGPKEQFFQQATLLEGLEMQVLAEAIQTVNRRVALAKIANELANAVTPEKPTLCVQVRFIAEWGDEGQQYIGASVMGDYIDRDGVQVEWENYDLIDAISSDAGTAFVWENTDLKVTYAAAQALFETHDVNTFFEES